jgi:hypothetical protein
MPITVGGIPAGTTADDLNDLNMVELWDYLLFPTVQPTYTIPTIVLNSSITGIKEVGETVSPVLTVVATKNDAAAYSRISITRDSLDMSVTTSPSITSAGDVPPQFGYPDPNNPNFRYGHTYTDSGRIVPAMTGASASTITYSSLGNYGAGVAKKDSKGINDARTPALRSANAPQSAGSFFQSNNEVINGYYPYYYGYTTTAASASAVQALINAGSGTKEIASGAGAIEFTFNVTAKWLWFAVYSGYPNKTAWRDPDNPLNNGNIGSSAFPPDLFAAPVTLNCNSFPAGRWSGIPYKIYVAQKITDIGKCIVFIRP